MTKFKSQALHTKRIKCWKASGSGNPPSLIPALQKIAILGLKTGLWQWYNGISVHIMEISFLIVCFNLMSHLFLVCSALSGSLYRLQLLFCQCLQFSFFNQCNSKGPWDSFYHTFMGNTSTTFEFVYIVLSQFRLYRVLFLVKKKQLKPKIYLVQTAIRSFLIHSLLVCT